MTTSELGSVQTYRDLPPDPEVSGRLVLPAGTIAGQFQLMEPIGRGAFGTVYRALHPVIGKEVAVKVLDCALSDAKLPVERFITEARAINRIRHRNVVAIFDFGELASGQKFYVMEFLQGETLAHALRRGRMSIDAALSVLEALAGALDAAHAAGVLHRDIKPSNVFLTREVDDKVTVKLLDFGVAKILAADATTSGSALGTPAYMAPEQHGEASLSAAADIYSLGVLAYELFTGTRPFKGNSALEVIRLHLMAEPACVSSLDPSLPRTLDGPLQSMLRKDASGRPATATVAVRALRLALANAQLSASDDPTLLAPPDYQEVKGGALNVDDITLEASSMSLGHELDAPRSRRVAGVLAGYTLAAAGALLLFVAWSRWWRELPSSLQSPRQDTERAVVKAARPPAAVPNDAATALPGAPRPRAEALEERHLVTPPAAARRVTVAPSATPRLKPRAVSQQVARPTTTPVRVAPGELEF